MRPIFFKNSLGLHEGIETQLHEKMFHKDETDECHLKSYTFKKKQQHSQVFPTNQHVSDF